MNTVYFKRVLHLVWSIVLGMAISKHFLSSGENRVQYMCTESMTALMSNFQTFVGASVCLWGVIGPAVAV